MSKNNLEYQQYRDACKWGERHGMIQYPDVKYPTKLGIDPTKLGIDPTKKEKNEKNS